MGLPGVISPLLITGPPRIGPKSSEHRFGFNTSKVGVFPDARSIYESFPYVKGEMWPHKPGEAAW